jgi:hypothetical protein
MDFDLANITIGADPEIFVGFRNEIVSAHHLPFGTKSKPRKTLHGSVQVDGLALEVNVLPSKSRFEFITNCGNVIADLERLLKIQDKEMYLVVQPTARFTEAYLESLPEEAKELGCNPDWNAYEMRENERPNANGHFRTTGGHVHIGWGTGFNTEALDHIGTCAEVAKQLDYTIGLASLDFDTDKTRREMYGKAGSFRPKPYGMEYRTMSPMWLLSSGHTAMVYQGCIKALRMFNEGKILDEDFCGLARDCIDRSVSTWRTDWPDLEKAIT